MIVLDLDIAIAVFLSGSFVVIFCSWVFSSAHRNDTGTQKTGALIQCPYCTHVFAGDREIMLNCPFCDSIIGENVERHSRAKEGR